MWAWKIGLQETDHEGEGNKVEAEPKKWIEV